MSPPEPLTVILFPPVQGTLTLAANKTFNRLNNSVWPFPGIDNSNFKYLAQAELWEALPLLTPMLMKFPYFLNRINQKC